MLLFNRDAVHFRIFKVFRIYFSNTKKKSYNDKLQFTSFKRAILEVSKRFCADSNSKKSDSKFPSGWPSHESGHPSVLRSQTNQGCIRLDVMATRPDALQGLKRIRFSFTNTYMGRQLHPSRRGP